MFAPITLDFGRNFIGLGSSVCSSALFKGWPTNTAFPDFRSGRMEYVNPAQHCGYLETLLMNSDDLPLGMIYRSSLQSNRQREVMENAERVLAEAQRLAETRGARFLVLITPTPGECQTQSYNILLEGFRTAYIPLLQYCPQSANELRSIQLPNDLDHFSPQGNRWLASVLFRVFSQEIAQLR